MKVVTAEQMQEIDRITIIQYGIPAEVLMALAGKSVADYIMQKVNPQSVAVFCGVGNNGGDGFVVAYLVGQHANVDVFIVGDLEKLSATTKIYFNVCKNANIPCTVLSPESLDSVNLNNYDCIVDALTGTGFTGKPRDLLAKVIQSINTSNKPVIAIDIPSGLAASGPVESDIIVKAHTTVTMGLPKVNCVTYPGKFYTGNLIVADIGFPKELTESENISCQLIDEQFIAGNYRLQLDVDAHKGSNGRLLCIGGFDGMEGAIMLTAASAFANGVGLLTVATTPQARVIIAGKIPEVITKKIAIEMNPLPVTIDTINSKEFNDSADSLAFSIETMLNDVNPTAIVCGPGIGRTVTAALVFVALCKTVLKLSIPVIIDGDGLFLVALIKDTLQLPAQCIITPHFKEASRIIGTPVDEIKKNRLQAAQTLAHTLGCVTVLKGPATIVTDGKQSLVNTTGNPALATAGSGDVLTGIIASICAKGVDPLVAASVGVYLHGRAADIFCSEEKSAVMQASDIIRYIRKAHQI